MDNHIIKKYHFDYDIELKNDNTNLSFQKNENNYILDVKKDDEFSIKIDNLDIGDILFLSFDLENNNSCNDGDLRIEINGVTNVLTCKDWKYHNRNTNFKYVLSSNSIIKELNVKLKKGKYVISNVDMYYTNYYDMLSYKGNISEFKFDKDGTSGNVIKGSINLKNDGYIATTIPYDEGFSIYLNGIKSDYVEINNGFVGVKAERGEYNVEIEYNAPLFIQGKMVSIFGIVILFMDIFVHSRKKINIF